MRPGHDRVGLSYLDDSSHVEGATFLSGSNTVHAIAYCGVRRRRSGVHEHGYCCELRDGLAGMGSPKRYTDNWSPSCAEFSWYAFSSQGLAHFFNLDPQAPRLVFSATCPPNSRTTPPPEPTPLTADPRCPLYSTGSQRKARLYITLSCSRQTPSRPPPTISSLHMAATLPKHLSPSGHSTSQTPRHPPPAPKRLPPQATLRPPPPRRVL